MSDERQATAEPHAHGPHEVMMGHFVGHEFSLPVRALAALSRGLAWLEGIGIGVSLFALAALASWQFIARNLRMKAVPALQTHAGLAWLGGLLGHFPAAPNWSDNVLRHSVFIIGFVGAMFATFTARHLRVDAVTRLPKDRGRLALRIVATLGAIAVCAVILHACWVYRDVVMDERSQSSEVFTAARGAMIVLVGTGVMVFHFFVQFLIDCEYLVTRRDIPAWWIAEAVHGGEGGAIEELSEVDAASASSVGQPLSKVGG